MYATTRGFLHAEHKTDRDDITKGEREGREGWKEKEEKKQRRQYGDDDDKMRRGKKQRGRSGGRKVENVRPDRDTEKRVAASEEKEAGLPWGRRFPRSQASRRGASSPTSLTPIPVHWPVGEKGKVYLFTLSYTLYDVVGCVVGRCGRCVDGQTRNRLREIRFPTGGIRARAKERRRHRWTRLFFFAFAESAKAISPFRVIAVCIWRMRLSDRSTVSRCLFEQLISVKKSRMQ